MWPSEGVSAWFGLGPSFLQQAKESGEKHPMFFQKAVGLCSYVYKQTQCTHKMGREVSGKQMGAGFMISLSSYPGN